MQRFQRVLLALLSVIGLVSALTLTSGVAGAASQAKGATSKQTLSLQAEHSSQALAPKQTLSSSPLSEYRANGSNDVTPHHGSVIHTPKVFLIFEGNWAASDMQGVNQYFTDVNGSSFEGILTQYFDSSGHVSNTIAVSGSVMDSNFAQSDPCRSGSNEIDDSGIYPTPQPGGGLDPLADIWYEITKEAGPIDPSTIYFVFTPKGYPVYGPSDSGCGTADAAKSSCGYHNNFLPTGAIYAVIPYGGGPCGGQFPGTTSGFPPGADPVLIDINTASHEQFEAITNPTGGGWYNTSDCGSGSTCEIGDKCSDEHPGISPSQAIYPLVQGEYSDATHDCVYPPMPIPVCDPDRPDTQSLACETAIPSGDFNTLWLQKGGPLGPLGDPIDSWYSSTGGQRQDFVGGGIFWSSSTGTHEVQGAIYLEYEHTGGPSGPLNFPTSDEQNADNSSGAAIGRENTFRGSGCTANDQGSSIIWSSSTGAHEVDGCIYQKYVELGGTKSFLGLPTSDEEAVNGGHASYFQGSLCYSSSGSGIFDGPGAGVHEVHGCIYNRYMSLGGPGGSLNFPTSDEQNVYNSSGAASGRENTFRGTGCTASNQGSAIISSSPGTYEVKGCIYQKYLALGGTQSFLGVPTSDEEAVGSGHASYFQGTGCGSSSYGAIFDESGAGVYSIHGCIDQHYQSLINAGVPLGYPTSDEQNVYNSSGVAVGRENTFSGSGIGCGSTTGSAIISTSTGTYVVESCIYQAYVNFGGAASALGLPVSDQYTNVGDLESDFQGGYITYNPNTGQTSVNLYTPGCNTVPNC